MPINKLNRKNILIIQGIYKHRNVIILNMKGNDIMAWERREEERIACNVITTCEKYVLENGQEVRFHQPLKMEIIDFSIGGIGFYIDIPVKVGSCIIFKIILDTDITISCKIKICWCEEENYKYRVGAKFAAEELKNEAMIRDFLDTTR